MDLSEFDKGFVQACYEIKDKTSASHQMVAGEEAHKIIDWLWGEIQKLVNEKLGRSAFDEPTVKIEIKE